jgi:hypothetical protein
MISSLDMIPSLAIAWSPWAMRRIAMSDFDVHKYAVMCMRLAAECIALAADVPEPDLRDHFLRMASKWTALAKLPRVLH